MGPVFVLSIGVAFVATPLLAPAEGSTAALVDPQFIFADGFEAPPPVNQPPLVDAGDDQTITLPAAAGLAGSADDDDLPVPPGALTLAWSQFSGPGSVEFDNPAAAATSATFSIDGVYVLRLTASDGVLASFDDVQITVNPVGTPPGPGLDYAGTVGPAGGGISAHQGRVVLSFPPGALTEETDIRVSPLTSVGVPGLITPSAFDFGPDGTVFTTPVTLTLRYDEADLPPSVDENTGLFIVGTSHSTGEIVPVPGSVVDPVANTVSAPISGFSVFGIAISCLPNSVLLPWCPPICTDPAPVFPDDSGGELDTTFGTDGVFTFELGLPGATGVDDLLIDDQGRLLLAVETARMGVARILPDGEGFDPTFGTDGIARLSSSDPDNTPGSIALRTDGRILLYGAQQPPGGGLYLQIARFLPNGALDSSFAQGGVMLDLRQGITLSGNLAPLPDGRIFVIDAGARSLYQFLPDGAPDPGFGVEGIATNTTLFTASRALRRATGDWLLARGKDILEVEVPGSPGRLFTSLAVGSFIMSGFQEIPGGGYVLGGSKFSGAGPGATRTPVAARFQPGAEPGSLEPDVCFGADEGSPGFGLRSFDFGGSKEVSGAAVQADGRILLVGSTTDLGTDDDAFVIRIRPDGEIDAGFGDNGIVQFDFGGDDAGVEVVIDSQGRIVIAGSSRPSTGDRFAVVTRLLP